MTTNRVQRVQPWRLVRHDGWSRWQRLTVSQLLPHRLRAEGAGAPLDPTGRLLIPSAPSEAGDGE